MSRKPPEVRFCWEVALKFIVKMDCCHDAGCPLDKDGIWYKALGASNLDPVLYTVKGPK